MARGDVDEHERLIRLGRVETMLAAGQWTIYDRVDLANEWGVSVDAVTKMATQVKRLQVERLKADMADPLTARATMVAEIQGARRVFLETVVLTNGKNATPGPLVKLFEMEMKLRGMADGATQHVHHTGSLTVDVKQADPVAQARAIVQAFPTAIEVLGLTVDDLVRALPQQLAEVEGQDLIEAVVVDSE